MSDLTKLEIEVLKMLLDGDDRVLVSLREQLDLVSVTAREMTGVGFFTDFCLPQAYKISPKLSNATFKFGDVHADILELEFGAGFLLYVEGGLIKMLEGHTYDETWFFETSNFKLNYINGGRDLEKLRSNWFSI